MQLTRSHLHKLNRYGDTIIEVMVVLAVLGLALSISYATANRSLLDTRAAEQNSQATALLQTQIEELRVLANSAVPSRNIFRATAFCVDTATQAVFGSHNAHCTHVTVNNSDYAISISYLNTAIQPDTFQLTATWTDLQNHGMDSATLVYRVHKG